MRSPALVLMLATLAFASAAAGPSGRDLSNQPVNPLADGARVNVIIFVRTDCPITNRYAPEIKRIAKEYASRGVHFWLVYPDRTETSAAIEKHISSFGLPGTPIRDPQRDIEKYAKASIAPEAAVFNSANVLVYRGRIDDRWVTFGVQRPAPTRHDLEVAIGQALDGKPVELPQTRAVGCYLSDLQ